MSVTTYVMLKGPAMSVHCLFSRPSLYRGWFPVISSLCCSNFVYFYTFNTLKKLATAGPGRPGPAKDLLMGVVSGEKTLQKGSDS